MRRVPVDASGTIPIVGQLASANGLSKSASSFFGEFPRVGIGHIGIGSEVKGDLLPWDRD